MTILSTAPQQRVSATQTADELSVLKANENEAIEMFHSDDPEERERGEAMLLSIVEHEQDLRKGCNRFIASAAKDDVFAAGLTGQIDALLVQVAQLEAQQRRFQKRAQRKRVYACSLLNSHFPEEKTHPTPWGNIQTQYAKPCVVNNDGGKLKVSDIPDDLKEELISKQEVTKTSNVSVIDEVKILRAIVAGQRFPFARLKENSTRFF